MPVMFVPFSEMNCAAGEHGGHTLLAQNCIPWGGNYRHLPKTSFGTATSLTGGAVTGAHVHVYPSGAGTSSYTGDALTVFVGTKTRLFTASPTSYSNISRASNYGAAGEPAGWRFVTFGNDIWATNYTDPLQRRADNAGNFADGVTSVFKPQPRFLAVVKSYLMGADLNNVGHYADSFAWCVPGNAANWDAAASGGGGTSRILSCPGQITGIVGGDYARVFKRNSLHSITYTGNVLDPWREDVISASIGTPFGSSIVKGRGDAVYFWGGDRFYRQVGLSAPEPIGAQLGTELTDYFSDAGFSRAIPALSYPTTMDAEDNVMVGVRCARSGVIAWFYGGEELHRHTHVVLYDPVSDLWSFGYSQNWFYNLAVSYPSISEELFLSGILAFGHAPGTGTTTWLRLDGSTCEEMVLRTGWQPIALDGAEKPVKVNVQGVLPSLTWKKSPGDRPDTVYVKITVANDPYLDAVIVSPGGQIQPRSEEYHIGADGSEDGLGYLPVNLTGAWIKVELRVEETDHLITAVRGVYLNVRAY